MYVYHDLKQGYSHLIIFQHSPPTFQATLSIPAQTSLFPQNKKVWAERQATRAPSFSGKLIAS